MKNYPRAGWAHPTRKRTSVERPSPACPARTTPGGDDMTKPRAAKKASEAARALGRRGGLKGGKARAEKLSPERRSEIARAAVRKRWGPPAAGGAMLHTERPAGDAREPEPSVARERDRVLRLLYLQELQYAQHITDDERSRRNELRAAIATGKDPIRWPQA